MGRAVLEINNTLKIKNRGLVIDTKLLDLNMSISIGDILYDMSGNPYKVSGIGSIRKYANNEQILEILLEGMEYCEYAQGKILFDTPNDFGFLFCNNPLSHKQPDIDYELEYNEATKFFKCYLYSYEDIINDSILHISPKTLPSRLIYRGWMLKPNEYQLLYNKLKEQGCYLINSPLEYEMCHLLPNWYKLLEDLEITTPTSIWTKDLSNNSLVDLLNHFSDQSVMVKDYVKSRKHEWFEACYIENASHKENSIRTINTFIKRQNNNLIGGIVLRKFETLKSIGYHPKSGMPISEEYRAFYLFGQLAVIIKYWDGSLAFSNFEESEINLIQGMQNKVTSNFFTVDFARQETGELIVMELGDGQVSGLQGLSEQQFYNRIIEIMNMNQLT